MDVSSLLIHIEALIFASDKPLNFAEITDLLNPVCGSAEDKITTEQVEAALERIVEKYSDPSFPFEVRQSGGGWQFLTKKIYHKTVVQLLGERFLKKLSAAALETLAIIAYKQPITKGEIETIRGVNSDYSVQKLLEKELIVISGRNEHLPGHPLVYATSKTFMDYFGINSVDDLPKIKEVVGEQMIEPTVIHHTHVEQGNLSVSHDGELIEGSQKEDSLTENDTKHSSTQPDEATEEAPQQPDHFESNKEGDANTQNPSENKPDEEDNSSPDDASFRHPG